MAAITITAAGNWSESGPKMRWENQLFAALTFNHHTLVGVRFAWHDLENDTKVSICMYFINPLTTKNEKFADFHETSTACSSWYTEFRTFRSFEISLSIQKLCKIFSFSVFLTVPAYLKSYFNQNYSAYRSLYAESRSVGIFEISFTILKL